MLISPFSEISNHDSPNVPGSKLLVFGMGHPTFNDGNPHDEYITPNYVDFPIPYCMEIMGV